MKIISSRLIVAVLAFAFQQTAFSAESIESPIRLGAGAIAGILKNCDAIREARKEIPKFEIRKDHFGRPGTIVANNGLEYVIQYSSSKDKAPSSIVGPGLNIVSNSNVVPREVIEKHLSDRVRLYRLVKGICGINSVTASSGKAASLIPGPGGSGGSWDDDVPVEYGDSGFWSAAWEPTIADYGISAAQNSWWENRASEIAARRAACLGACNDACDIGSDFAGVVGCGTVGLGLMATGVGAFTGAAVLLACGSGAITGKYWCKWSTCPSNCGG